MSRFKNIMPVLRVADIDKSIAWYTGVLGFELSWRGPNDGGGDNCMLNAGATSLMLSTGAHLGDRPAFTGTLYFGMDGVRGLFATVKDRADVVWPLEVMDYGTVEFGIRDLDGYTLAFAERAGSDGDSPD